MQKAKSSHSPSTRLGKLLPENGNEDFWIYPFYVF